jgi:outer membrane immunogenic protein
MNKLQISAITFALTSVAAGSAFAQKTPAQSWAGASVDVKAGYATFMPKIGNGTVVNSNRFVAPSPAAPGYVVIPAGSQYATTTADASNLNTATAAVELGYNFAIDQDKLLGLGLTYYTGATGSGNGTLYPTSNGGTAFPQVNVNYQLKNLWAISLTPGYALDNNRLVYGKVGYTGVTIGASGSSAPNTLGVGGSSVPYQTVTLSGFNVGLGYKQIITGSLYWLGEVNYASFGNKNATIGLTNTFAGGPNSLNASFGGSGYNFLVGVGYRF